MKRLLSLFVTISIVFSCLVTSAPSATAASNDYTTWRQADSAWNQSEAWPASQYPNATLHYMSQAGCLVTSIAMLLRHYNVVTDSNVTSFNPWVCNETLKSAKAFNSAADIIWGNVCNAYSGFKYVGNTGYSASKLYDLYNQGYACIVAVNGYGHYVAVKSATASGSVIMDPGWGYTSLSSFNSVNAIYYFSVTASKPIAHTCDKGEYVYFWKAHPHPSCYKCSICGEIWADHSTTNYFESCDICNSEITISGANTPSYFNVGHGMTIQGTISSGSALTNVTVGCYDYNGTMLTGKSVAPNSKSFNINSIDADVRFSSLAPGVYTYRVTATNSGGTKTLVEKVFTVLSDKATVQDGIYSILSNSKTCAVSAVSKDSGSNIELATVDSYDTMQQFKVRYAGSGYYTLQNLASGKWLSVVDNSWEACTNVILRKGDSAKGQLWQIIPNGDGYCLVPQCATICCLDVHDGAIGRPGENVWIYIANSTAAQQFQMVLRRVYVSFDANGGAVGNAFMTGKADEIDVDRGQYKTVIYTTGGQTIETNKFGTEAAVNANGLVTAIRDYGTDTLLTVPDGGFVISSHSTSVTNPTGGFVESLKVGDYVDFQPYYMELKAYKSQSDYLVYHKNAVIGDSYGPLPTATRNGYIFDGWYTESTGGKQVTAFTKVTASSNHTLYAHWTKQEEPVVPPVTPTTGIHFPKVSTYTQGQFTDVPAAQWFTKNVANAVELGLMKGSSATTFKPYGDVTLAEAITMAARIHSIYTTGSETFVQAPGSKWYQVYLDYALENRIITKAYYNCDVNHKATRAQFAEIFANSLPDKGLYPMNSIEENAIPDVKSTDSYASYVYKLYRAGILTGGDAKGTFSPGTYITRAESAAIVSRMAESNNRVAFTLQ